MKVNVFNGYCDTCPKESSLDEIVRIIREDVSLKERTEKHRYYLKMGWTKEAKAEKAAGLNFAVAARFRNGKDANNITELSFMGMVEFDHLTSEEVAELTEVVRKDPHTLMNSISIGAHGVHVFFLYIVRNLTEADSNRYADIYGVAFDVASSYYAQLTGKQPDMNCRKVT